MSKELIRLEKCVMAFDDEIVLNAIDLTIQDKEFLTLLGPSGCGKTTTLRIIGGFETPTSGTLYFDGVVFNDVPPYRRRVNTVFQRYALFPHLNVFENVAFGLRISKTPKADIPKLVLDALHLVGLSGYEKRRVHQLSGGQQQRVAIARAISTRPPIIMADEPTGALDSRTGREVLAFLQQLNREGSTVILITHDAAISATARRLIRISDGLIVEDKWQEVDWYEPMAGV